eukprot:NODE_81_length_22753_cov_0.207072.p10 type:complete len:142 gc:universal NODE_81_length_22753_cov_0.207072:17259-17684(+)
MVYELLGFNVFMIVASFFMNNSSNVDMCCLIFAMLRLSTGKGSFTCKFECSNSNSLFILSLQSYILLSNESKAPTDSNEVDLDSLDCFLCSNTCFHSNASSSVFAVNFHLKYGVHKWNSLLDLLIIDSSSIVSIPRQLEDS